MHKKKLTILIIDRPLKDGELAVKDIFRIYGPKYGLIMFPPKEDDEESRIQLVFYEYNLIKEFESLFFIGIDYDPNDLGEFFDFDLTEIAEDAFYDVLAQNFEIETFNLTTIEK